MKKIFVVLLTLGLFSGQVSAQALDVPMDVSTSTYALVEVQGGFFGTHKEFIYTLHCEYTYSPNTYKITSKKSPWIQIEAPWGDFFRAYTRNEVNSSAYLNSNNSVRFNGSFDLLCDINGDGFIYDKISCGTYWINCVAATSGVISEGSST